MDLNHSSFFAVGSEMNEYVNEPLKNQLCKIESIAILYNNEPLVNRFGNKIAKITFKIVKGEHLNKISVQEFNTEVTTGSDGKEHMPRLLRYLVLNTGYSVEAEAGKKIIPEKWYDEIIGKKVIVNFKQSQGGYVSILNTQSEM